MAKYKTFPIETEIPVFDNLPDRVEFIADLMEDLVWKRGKSAKVLAKVWGLSKSTVETYSAEASRLVTADRDQVARNVSVMGEKLLRTAFDKENAKDFALVGKLLADISGANAPTKQDITVSAESVNTDRARRLMANVFGGSAGKTATDDLSAAEGDVEAPATDPSDD